MCRTDCLLCRPPKMDRRSKIIIYFLATTNVFVFRLAKAIAFALTGMSTLRTRTCSDAAEDRRPSLSDGPCARVVGSRSPSSAQLFTDHPPPLLYPPLRQSGDDDSKQNPNPHALGCPISFSASGTSSALARAGASPPAKTSRLVTTRCLPTLPPPLCVSRLHNQPSNVKNVRVTSLTASVVDPISSDVAEKVAALRTGNIYHKIIAKHPFNRLQNASSLPNPTLIILPHCHHQDGSSEFRYKLLKNIFILTVPQFF